MCIILIKEIKPVLHIHSPEHINTKSGIYVHYNCDNLSKNVLTAKKCN